MAKSKGLATLIKVAKQKLDSLRRELAALENDKQKMLDAIVRLQEELKRETELASQNPEMGAFFGDFAKRIRLSQENFRMQIKKLDAKIDKLRDNIREQFAEQKRYEIAKQAREKEEALLLEKNEIKELDEIAAIQHRRKKEIDISP